MSIAMRRVFGILLLVFGNGWADARSSSISDIGCSANSVVFELPKAGLSVTLKVVDNIDWLEFRELGQQISVSGAPASSLIHISQPLRLGLHWLRVQPDTVVTINQVEHDHATGKFQLTAHCALTRQQQSRIDWLSRLSELDAAINSPPDRRQMLQAAEALEALHDQADSSSLRALSVHVQALALLAASDQQGAARVFAKAERLWRAEGELDRAIAARLGQIYAHHSAGNYARVLADTEALLVESAPANYFTARMLNERCVTLEDLGRFNEADTCYQKVLSQLKTLDEMPEYATVLKNFASLQRKLGKLDIARKLASEGLAVAAGPGGPMARGRFHLLLSAVDKQEGDIAASLREIHLANVEFEHAGAVSLFWRASSRLDEAILLEQLGSYYEAYGALAEASELLPPQDSLGLRAKIFSELEADMHRYRSALFWARLAEDTLARNGLVPLWQVTHVERLRLQLHQGEAIDVAESPTARLSRFPVYEQQRQLLSIEAALKHDDPEAALRGLVALRAKSLPLRDELQYAMLDAEYRQRHGDFSGAQRLLLRTGERVMNTAIATNNPVLGYAIARQRMPLQRSAFEIALRHRTAHSTDSTLEELWPWLTVDERQSRIKTRAKNVLRSAEGFDRAVAAELLGSPSVSGPLSESVTQRQLLSLLAQAGGSETYPIGLPNVSRETFQQELDADSAFVAYIDGNRGGALLWVTRDSAQLMDTAVPDQIRSDAMTLRAMLRAPDSPETGIDRAARRLSADLFGSIRGSPPPRRLYVLGDDLTDAIAWNTLSWPGHLEALVDSTAVSMVRFANEEVAAGDSVLELPTAMHVLVASQRTRGTPLPELTGADAEAAQIRSALDPDQFAIDEHLDAAREMVISALRNHGSWVHIAAHGAAQPQRTGYAGIWLEPPGDDEVPSFLSWIDILDSGVNADLVVLNACQLGDSGSAINGNLSFADAVSRAGAKHVVAALWPVSDAAAALWVPAFYSAITADPRHDAAEALRAAQLRLRESRAFRHPFFWAGMQVIDRMPIGSKAMH